MLLEDGQWPQNGSGLLGIKVAIHAMDTFGLLI